MTGKESRIPTRAPSRAPSRIPSRVPSRHVSRAGSVVSAESAGAPIPVENISFVSHLSNLGRGVGGGANLEEITVATAVLTGAYGPRSETGSVYADPLHRESTEAGASSKAEAAGSCSSRPSASGIGAGGEGVRDQTASAEESVLADNVTVWHIALQFLRLGYPLSLSALAQFSLNTVIVSVNGKLLGDLELGGATLATGLVNATGFAFGAGLCGAMETVLPHTYGAYQRECQMVEEENAARLARREQRKQQQPISHGRSGKAVLPPGVTPSPGASSAGDDDVQSTVSSLLEPPRTLYMYGIYAQRMAIILFVVAFPLGFILVFADLGLQSVGESASVLYYTGIWCRYAVFGIPATLAYQLTQRYYSCQSITKPLSIAMVTAALANPVLQIVFVKLFGFAGSPVAWLLLMCAIVAGLIGYMRHTGLHKLTWGGWNEKSLQNLGSLTALALPSMGVMLSEWVALEVNALAGGFAPTEQLAAYSITLQVFGIMWGVGSGVMMLAAVFVGGAVGARKPHLARRIGLTAIGIMICVAILDIIAVYLLNPVIPWLFTNDAEVVRIYQELTYFILPYHLFDTFQSTVMGILRGCELQKLGALLITITFCVFGVPLSFLLFFHFDIGVRALWIGPFAGVACFGTPCYLYVLLRYIKWEDLRPHTEGPVIPVEEEEFDKEENEEENMGGGGGRARFLYDDGSSVGEDGDHAEDVHVREYVDETVRHTQSGVIEAAPAKSTS